MKKILFLGVSLFLVTTVATAQVAKNKQFGMSAAATAYAEKISQQHDVNDVSLKSTIRFDMHNTTAAERMQANADQHAQWVAKNPNYDAERNAYEQSIQNYIQANKHSLETTQSVLTLPVVIHCVYGSAAQNITLNQVLSQIQVMNEDFARTNTDANTHWAQAANTTIQFCLAQRDPSGVATTGLETRQSGTSSTSWSTNDAVKSYASGGLNAWDPTRYLNIWVCNLSGGLLGYGEFPTGTVSQTFGVVIDYTCFGSNYTLYGTFAGIAAPFDRGRTVTHEFSHCFNLYHIWGDDNGACNGSDLCADTPNQADATSGCYAYPHTDGCTTTNPGIMYENYMDYSDDNCLNLFTANQKTRMLAVLNAAPYNALTTSNGCQSPTASSLDAAITTIISPNGNICGTSFTPVVTIKNWGTTTMTSCTIKYQVDATTLQTYSWTGSLTTNATANVTLPGMTTTSGTHTFTAYTQGPNGGADQNTANDQTVSNFSCLGSGSLPFFEGFEGTTFVPAGWQLNNPDASNTWARTTTCAKTGVACARMDNFTYQTGVGQRDEIITPAVNLSTVLNPVLTFQVAYTYWTVPYQYSDTLEVLVSTDCGTTWTSVYQKYGANLQTAPPVSSNTTPFTPTAAQWRLETVSLLPYQSATSLFVKFRNGSSYEDDMYLDDINIMNSLGVPSSSPLAASVNLFPNPSSGIFNLNIALGSQKNLDVKVLNTLGQTVQQFAEGNTYGGQYTLDLSAQANGVYFVQVTAGEEKTVQRIVVNR